jgi:hypothetical protein
MEQRSSWSHSISQEIYRLLRKPNTHYRFHKTPPLDPILSQTNPVHNFPAWFPTIQSMIIFPSTTRSSKLSLPSRFTDQNIIYIYIYFSYFHAICPAHYVLLVLISLIVFGKAYKLWCSTVQPPATSSLSYPNILLSILFFYYCEKPSFIPIQNNE